MSFPLLTFLANFKWPISCISSSNTSKPKDISFYIAIIDSQRSFHRLLGDVVLPRVTIPLLWLFVLGFQSSLFLFPFDPRNMATTEGHLVHNGFEVWVVVDGRPPPRFWGRLQRSDERRYCVDSIRGGQALCCLPFMQTYSAPECISADFFSLLSQNTRARSLQVQSIFGHS